jgi:RsiW-degrading membrane proteinase PrsW (M82 family)
MKKSVVFVGMLLYVFLLLPVNVHAYLDMGTGSMILQLLVAGLAGAVVFLRVFWTRIKNIFSHNKKENPADINNNIDSAEPDTSHE